MLHEFLHENRAELIERCRAKVRLRPTPRPTSGEMEHGIPLFLGQLIQTLREEQSAPLRAPPPAGHGMEVPAIEATATKHGGELLRHGFSVDQVVHDYGDLCQAVTELAIETRAPVAPDEFHTLNRCLDQAIADAVTEFARQRDVVMADSSQRAMSERLGFLAHELRNFLNTAMLSHAAIKSGTVAANGATSQVLDRSLAGLRDLIDHALADVRLGAGPVTDLEEIAVASFIAEVKVAASLAATASQCEFLVLPVEPDLEICADHHLLYSALSNLLQNAFKFTRRGSRVALKAYGAGGRVFIEVADECGGLPAGKAETMFLPFVQHSHDRTGLGLGLSIARRAVEACKGTLSVRDMPGAGCVFTIELPRHC